MIVVRRLHVAFDENGAQEKYEKCAEYYNEVYERHNRVCVIVLAEEDEFLAVAAVKELEMLQAHAEVTFVDLAVEEQ